MNWQPCPKLKYRVCQQTVILNRRRRRKSSGHFCIDQFADTFFKADLNPEKVALLDELSFCSAIYYHLKFNC